MEDQARQLRELWDREGIRQLVALYCHYVRTRAYDEIVELYAPDGVFDMPANMAEGGVRSGREAIRETFRRHGDTMDPWPFTHNHVIRMTGDGRAEGFVYTEFRQGCQNMRVTHVGHYADVYVKVGDAWRFHSRRLTTVDVPA